jgi:rubredoxin
MEKVITGWRERRDWEQVPKSRKGSLNMSDMVEACLESMRSHDGWFCPHCKYKQDYRESDTWEGLGDEGFMTIQNGGLDPVSFTCPDCGKKYFVRSFVNIKFYSCIDQNFDYETFDD